jgi:hypothetical protein
MLCQDKHAAEIRGNSTRCTAGPTSYTALEATNVTRLILGQQWRGLMI